ncbi:MAG: RNA polymerase sigma factor [Anaerolineales bacterium]|nr:RNA polymerase sigma factor [Anaerolineales bacterium]
METAESSRLISLCMEGDEQAIEALVHRYESDVFRLTFSILQDSHEAHEATQDTFIAALNALRSYREKSSFKAWILTIALNRSRSRLRKRKVLEKLRNTLTAIFHVETQQQVSPEDTVLQTEKETAIWDALSELDERHRIVMVLRYYQDLPATEIAEILSLHEGTVHSRLHTARERLRTALKPFHGDENK